MFRSLRTLRSFPRIKDIALVLARHGFNQVAGYLQSPLTSRLRRLFSGSPAPHVVEQPERLRLVLQDLGPTFIKFGQLLSTRPDLLPENYIRELEKLQDHVSPSPWEEIQSDIEGELGGRLDSFFADFEKVPLATASIAQVHRATTLSGEPVVVKVLKRGLERVIEQDLQVLHLLVGVMSEWPAFLFLDLEGVLRAFDRVIHRELNFDYERFNIQRIRDNFKGSTEVYIPQVYRELSRERVLTMEFIAGEKLASLRPGTLASGQGEVIASRITIALIKQIFEDGIYHGDPHPGNFILMDGGRIGLIDFGNVGKFTPEMMDDLVLLLHHLIRRDYRSVARRVLKIGRPSKDVDSRTLALDLLDSLDQYYGQSVAEIHFGALFQSVFSIAFRYGIVMPPQYVLLGRTLMTLEGVVRTLAPQIELLSKIQPYLERVMKERWAPSRILREVETEVAEIVQSVRTYPVNLAEILQRVADGRLRLDANLQNTERIERRLQELSSRLPLALLVFALLVSSSLLFFSAAQSGGGKLLSTLGMVGYIGAMVLILRIFLKG
jgi:ubiquinone biosynthesis protein